MTISGFFSYALFVFWYVGIVCICVDFDHIFVILGRKSPIRLSESFGRPFHTRTVFTFVAIAACGFMVAFAYGFYRGVLLELGEGGTIVFLLILIIITYGVSKYLGKKLLQRMVLVRIGWRKQNKENIK